MNQSVAYEDPRSGQQREGDVLADYPWFAESSTSYVEAAVECKSAKDHPWLAFYDKRRGTPRSPTAWFVPTKDWQSRAKDLALVTFEWARDPALTTDRVATHVVTALGNDKINPASDAVRQALSFALARSKAERLFQSNLAADDRGIADGLVVPVVVTQAPLFACQLDENGEIAVKPVDQFDVWVWPEHQKRHRVYVRTEASFGEMAKAFSRLRSSFDVDSE